MGINIRLTNKKKTVCLTAGVLASVLCLVVPLAVIYEGGYTPKPVDLVLSGPLPHYYSLTQIKNGVSIKVSDDFAHKYYIKKIVLDDGFTIHVIGNKSAVVSIVMLGSSMSLHVLHIKDNNYSSYSHEMGHKTQWMLSAANMIKSINPAPQATIDLQKLPTLPLKISANDPFPPLFMLVHSSNGLFFVPSDSLVYTHRIGSITVNNQIIPASDANLRTVYIDTSFQLSVIDLYTDYYVVVHSMFVNPEDLPFSLVSVLKKNITLAYLSVENFFNNYVNAVQALITSHFTDKNYLNIDLLDQYSSEKLEIMVFDKSFFILPKNSAMILGKISLGHDILHKPNPFSNLRIVLFHRFSNLLYSLAIDQYDHFGLVSRGFSIVRAQVSDASPEADPSMPDYDADDSSYSHIPEFPAVHATSDVELSYLLSLFKGAFKDNLNKSLGITRSGNLSSTSEERANLNFIDVDLGADELPKGVVSMCGDVCVISKSFTDWHAMNAIGNVKWGDSIIHHNDPYDFRVAIIFNTKKGYRFFTVDSTFTMGLDSMDFVLSDIYNGQSNLPKWFTPLPVVEVVDVFTPFPIIKESISLLVNKFISAHIDSQIKEAELGAQSDKSGNLHGPSSSDSQNGNEPETGRVSVDLNLKSMLNPVLKRTSHTTNGVKYVIVSVHKPFTNDYKIGKIINGKAVLYENTNNKNLLVSFQYFNNTLIMKIYDNVDGGTQYLAGYKFSRTIPVWFENKED